VIVPVSPPRFTDIPAGEIYTFRARALALRPGLPAVPMWRWRITHASGQVIAPIASGSNDSSVVEFKTVMTGVYTIQTEVIGASPACLVSERANATLPNQRSEQFWIRATPPVGRACPPSRPPSPSPRENPPTTRWRSSPDRR
jgi:hypothetical protein